MQYTIEQMHNHLYKKVNAVYDVFKNFFGEEKVDLHEFNTIRDRDLLKLLGISKSSDDTYEISEEVMKQLEKEHSEFKVCIYVWWPDVTVTNENDKSIHIKDLYAKVTILCDGTIPYEDAGFKLNRATYTLTQFACNYLHSHVEGIPKNNFTYFQNPCLGRGPINNTIMTLKNNFDETMWMLFCEELDLYVTVESLHGGPYKRLEEVGRKGRMISHPGYSFSSFNTICFTDIFGEEKLKEFIVYYLKHGHLSISYKYNRFTYGMSYYDYIIDVSNAFIDFYNANLRDPRINLKQCYDHHLLYKTVVVDKAFYSDIFSDDAEEIIKKYSNKPVLGFKGKEIFTTIIDDTVKTPNHESIIVNHYFAMWLLKNILKTINYRYKNEHYSKTGNATGTSSSGRRTLYI